MWENNGVPPDRWVANTSKDFRAGCGAQLAKAADPEARDEAVPCRSEHEPRGRLVEGEKCANDLCC